MEETDNDKDFIMLSVGELKMVSYFRDGMCSVFFHLGYLKESVHASIYNTIKKEMRAHSLHQLYVKKCFLFACQS